MPEPTAVPPTAVPAAEKLILATTTSTADSGLLDFILPDFESKFNAEVDVIAVGSGQAIEIGSQGRRGRTARTQPQGRGQVRGRRFRPASAST